MSIKRNTLSISRIAILFMIVLCGSAISLAAEIASTTYAPIIHKTYFIEEDNNPNILYRPKFAPEFVTFDQHNRPYIRAELQDNFGQSYIAVQTLDDHGEWININLIEQAKKQLKWNGLYLTGRTYEERIVFDRSGDAYTYIDATHPGSPIRNGLLMHSKDRGLSWTAHILEAVKPGYVAKLEFQDGHNQIKGPPSILIHAKHATVKPLDPLTHLQLLIVKKNTAGDLITPFPSPTLIADDSMLGMQHSGAGNNTVTSGNLTHIVYPALGSAACPNGGTPAFGRTFNRAAGTFSGTTATFLGCGDTSTDGNPLDVHNLPVVSIDSQGYLQVVIGAHHRQFKYGKSPLRNSFKGWNQQNLEKIGRAKGRAKEGGYTYASLVTDSSDTLHIVARYAGLGYASQKYAFQLVYLRKPAGQPWSTFLNPNDGSRIYGTKAHKLLVYPFRQGYTVYRHKLNIDNLGRLFLNYTTRGASFYQPEVDAYCKKWPSECGSNRSFIADKPQCTVTRSSPCWYQKKAQEHTPVIQMSADGGDTWKIATSDDFRKGIFTGVSKRHRSTALSRD